ncbi:MAG: alpha/beta fold hydrolase [Planctomycetia bacterium]|nr:alpha/beta fold hydrolase [Planctomycetia bacterium]
MRMIARICGFTALFCGAPVLALAAGAREVTVLRTPAGVRFGIIGERPAEPAATLFVFATSVEKTLADGDQYGRAGRKLLDDGVFVVSVDVPGHGQDLRADEPEGIAAWRSRVLAGEPLVNDFVSRASGVLDYLVAEKYTDPARVAACGTSRGGYMALQFAAADPRVRTVAAFAPVTRPSVLREFVGTEADPRVSALALSGIAERLTPRSVWLWIGNNDVRVNTDDCIRFARKIAKGARLTDQVVDVELHVLPASGHRVADAAYDAAATWLRDRLLKGK